MITRDLDLDHRPVVIDMPDGIGIDRPDQGGFARGEKIDQRPGNRSFQQVRFLLHKDVPYAADQEIYQFGTEELHFLVVVTDTAEYFLDPIPGIVACLTVEKRKKKIADGVDGNYVKPMG